MFYKKKKIPNINDCLFLERGGKIRLRIVIVDYFIGNYLYNNNTVVTRHSIDISPVKPVTIE